MARHVVFTGFGPFADVSYNPSWDCAQAAAEAAGTVAELLPVTFAAAERFCRASEDSLFVHFGVAAARSHVSLERYAHNWWQDYGDVSPRRILDDGPAALETTLPLDQWALELDGSAGFGWMVSHDAGTYVCNATLYHSLLAGCDAVFVHVPQCLRSEAVAIGGAIGRHLMRKLM